MPKGQIPYNKRYTEDFIKLAKKVHEDEYDYSLVEYIDSKTNIKIICKEHGIFEQNPGHHLEGSGCPFCKGCGKLNTESFIKKATEKHNNKYDYSKVNYINNKTEIIIVCPIHGDFEQRPDSHLRGIGCQECGLINRKTRLNTTENFIENANKIHGFKYDYSKSIYTGAHNSIEIICKKHGPFWQHPNSHLRGSQCPYCGESNSERKIRIFLNKNNILFVSQKTFDNCRYIGKLKFDFYLPNYDCCIEFDGEQHFNAWSHFGGDIALERQKIKDKIKEDFCEKIIYYYLELIIKKI